MGMPVEIALADSMKSPKSMKSIEIHRYPLIPTRPLVVSGVQRWGGKKQKHENFMSEHFFHVANHPETTHNTHNDRTNHQNRPQPPEPGSTKKSLFLKKMSILPTYMVPVSESNTHVSWVLTELNDSKHYGTINTSKI